MCKFLRKEIYIWDLNYVLMEAITSITVLLIIAEMLTHKISFIEHINLLQLMIALAFSGIIRGHSKKFVEEENEQGLKRKNTAIAACAILCVWINLFFDLPFGINLLCILIYGAARYDLGNKENRNNRREPPIKNGPIAR